MEQVKNNSNGNAQTDRASSVPELTARALAAHPLDEDFRTVFKRERLSRGISDRNCYNAAAVDRKLYWSIFHRTGYKPKKRTAIALILTLRPSAELMADLLRRLGYCLTHSDLFDIVIESCLEREIFDVERINDILYAAELPILGSRAE